MSILDGWEGAGVVFKIHALSARRLSDYSWVAREEESPAICAALFAPGAQFESRGVFSLNDVNLRHEVQSDASLRGAAFDLKSASVPQPLKGTIIWSTSCSRHTGRGTVATRRLLRIAFLYLFE